jgi:hypothetical protein
MRGGMAGASPNQGDCINLLINGLRREGGGYTAHHPIASKDVHFGGETAGD